MFVTNNMEKRLNYKMKTNKKGLSTIITTLILIALVLGVTGVAYGISTGFVQEQLTKAGKCFGVFNKMTINLEDTCYDTLNEELQLSISIKELELKDIYIVLEDESSSTSFKLKDPSTPAFVKEYGIAEYGLFALTIPDKNSGITYVTKLNIAGLTGEKPKLIQISPIIDGEQCNKADSLNEIPYCSGSPEESEGGAGKPIVPYCGNGECDSDETSTTCPGDCPVLIVCDNDGICDSGETNANCPSDCVLCTQGTCSGNNICNNNAWIAHCGDGICNCGETSTTCSGDCALTGNINDYLAYYPFNGNANDASINHYDGVLYGNPILYYDSKGQSAYSFGNGKYIELNSLGNSIAGTEQSFTLSAWVYAPYTSFINSWIFGGNGQYMQFVFGLYQRDLYLRWRPGSSDYELNSNREIFGATHHVVGVYNATTNDMRIYLDGVSIASMTTASGLEAVDVAKLYIGAGYSGNIIGDYFYGMIDEVKVWKRPLSSAEVSQLYTAGGAANVLCGALTNSECIWVEAGCANERIYIPGCNSDEYCCKLESTTPIEGNCGPASDSNSRFLTAQEVINVGLCDIGTPSEVTETTTPTDLWVWTCSGLYGGQSVECNARKAVGLPLGTPCTTSTAYECLYGICVDGVCCNNACEGPCQICSGSDGGPAGTCHNVLSGQDPSNECSGISGIYPCATGTCNGLGTCGWITTGEGLSDTCQTCTNTLSRFSINIESGNYDLEGSNTCDSPYICNEGSCVHEEGTGCYPSNWYSCNERCEQLGGQCLGGFLKMDCTKWDSGCYESDVYACSCTFSGQ